MKTERMEIVGSQMERKIEPRVTSAVIPVDEGRTEALHYVPTLRVLPEVHALLRRAADYIPVGDADEVIAPPCASRAESHVEDIGAVDLMPYDGEPAASLSWMRHEGTSLCIETRRGVAGDGVGGYSEPLHPLFCTLFRLIDAGILEVIADGTVRFSAAHAAAFVGEQMTHAARDAVYHAGRSAGYSEGYDAGLKAKEEPR